MLKSPSLPFVLTALVIASQGLACGRSVGTGTVDLPAAGSTSDNGGSGGSETDGPDVTGGSGGLPSSAGSPQMGGSTASDGGSGVLGGSGGVTGIAGADGGTGGAGEEPNKIILFDGSEESFKDWVSVRNHGQNPWEDNGDGTMTVRVNTGDIQSKQKFQNVFVHLEYVIPHIIPQGASPHERGDSGVLLNGSYELQILDVTSSYDLNPTLGCGAVYNVRAPLEVACHEQEVWNTYEIEFQAPICDPEDPSIVVTPARFVEVKLNGTLIHRNVDVLAPTQGGQPERCEPQGLLLQDRGTIVPVFFRNIWAIPRN